MICPHDEVLFWDDASLGAHSVLEMGLISILMLQFDIGIPPGECIVFRTWLGWADLECFLLN